ncbi:hypothetical protein, partial [Nitrosomonas sp.]|uniref:hypothetical protein n=1 Tax=Nitrosomonas sp. TaxID=42353 RepID=UPI0032ED77BE
MLTAYFILKVKYLLLLFSRFFRVLAVRIPSVVYSIQENTVDEHTQTHSLNIIGSSGNLAAIS